MSQKDKDFPNWLNGFLFFLPLGNPLFFNLILSDFFLSFGIFLMILSALRDGRIRVHTSDIAMIAFFGFSFLGIDIVSFPKSYLLETATLVYLYVGANAISRQIKDPREILHAMRKVSVLFFPLLFFLAFVYSFHLLGIEILSGEFLADKLRWPYHFPNQLGIYLLAAFPMAIGSRSLSDAKAFFCYFAFILVLGAIGSRSCLFLGFLEIFWVEFFLRGGISLLPKWMRLMGILFIAVFVAITLSQEWPFLRAIGAIKGLTMFSDKPRFLQLTRVWDFSPFCITGLGLGCFKNSYGEEVHNTIFSLLVESGIGGLFMFFAWFSLSVIPVFPSLSTGDKNLHHAGKILLFVLAIMAILGMVHNLIRNRFIWMAIGFIMGLGFFKPEKEALDEIPLDLPVLSGK